jgi:Protein of unknown function (DUF3131)
LKKLSSPIEMRTLLVAIVGAILVIGGFVGWNINYTNNSRLPVPPTHLFPIPGNIFHTSSTTSTGENNGSTSTTTAISTTTSLSSQILTPWEKEWLNYSNIAWQYFTPGFGVDATTGINYASQYYNQLSDWDLAGYIMAILAAQELGIISQNGTWGAYYRLNLIFNFLQDRPLTKNNLTYQFYDATTGQNSKSNKNEGNPYDEGRLLIALHYTELLDPSFAPRISEAINRVNYTYFGQQLRSIGTYSDYCAQGYRLWNISTNVPSLDASEVVNGSYVVSDPVLLSMLEGVNDSYLTQTSLEMYNALYSYYNRTSIPLALGEGGYPYQKGLIYSYPYVYEGIEIPDGNNYSVVEANGTAINVSPITFTKTSFALYAIYGSNFGKTLLDQVGLPLTTPHGFSEGYIVSGNQVITQTDGNANNMIMESAVYAIYAL